MNAPTPQEVAAARAHAGLTQQQAAELVYLGSFRRWSEYERGVSVIDLARWELFLIKTGQHDRYGDVQAERSQKPRKTPKGD